MAVDNKNPILCIMTECQFYSEQIIKSTEEEVKHTYCSSPNWAILSITRTDQSCPSYRLDWTKRNTQIPTPATPSTKPTTEPEESTASIIPRKFAIQPEIEKSKKPIKRKNDSTPKPRPPRVKKPIVDFAPPATPIPGPELETTKPFSHMKNLPPPEETVRQFIESWNSQDFATEYHCLSHTLPLPPLGDYIQSRKSIYQGLAEQIGKGTAPQQIAEIKKVEFRTGGVYIECLRKDLLGKEEKEYQQEFLLRREEGGWKITRVQTRRHKTA